MTAFAKGPRAMMLVALLAIPATAGFAAQPNSMGENSNDDDVLLTVYGSTKGPEIKGIISARSGDRMQVVMENGRRAVITIDDETEIKASGGFLGLGGKDRAASSLFTGLPVTVKTARYENVLVARQIKFKNDDLKTAAMIHGGTNARFSANEAAIKSNAAATEALKSRVGDLDEYNVKATTNVYFDSGKTTLSGLAQDDLCAAASEAEAMDNALLLVVGYTDSTGSYEINQQLSEKRAARVVNYLQQACGWKPYRMLTPTGMADYDPAASNDTREGKAQNRRVAVNVLVSKAVDGL